jgi:hypothetical protein
MSESGHPVFWRTQSIPGGYFTVREDELGWVER